MAEFTQGKILRYQHEINSGESPQNRRGGCRYALPLTAGGSICHAVSETSAAACASAAARAP